jgi:hypothetical protein
LDCFSAAHLQRRRREKMMAYSSATKNCWESSDTSVCVCRVSPFICFSCFVLLLIFGSCRFFVFFCFFYETLSFVVAIGPGNNGALAQTLQTEFSLALMLSGQS